MAEVDAVEMPMIFCLLDQIGETPPHDLLAVGEYKAAQREAERDKQGALSTFSVEKGKVRRKGNGD